MAVLLLAGACTPVSTGEKEGDGRRQDFTAGWTFRLGDVADAAQPAYDDSEWRKLNLPHDWAIEGDFSKDNPSGTGGGALPGGVGWYRKTFTVDKADEGKRFYIDFDGVYMNSTVYINGHALGTRPYGYISFSYDLTPYLKWGAENVLAVRVDNAEQPNSRWYSGCGIYRNVWLRKLSPVHVAQWGTYVTADEVTKNHARLTVRTTVDNCQSSPATLELRTELVDAEGRVVAQAPAASLEVQPQAQAEARQELALDNPMLWSIEHPYLYDVRTTVLAGGEVADVYHTPFGIRTFKFDAKKGFFLNGQHVKINGVCMHHDLGCLGAAVNTRAIERQLEIASDLGRIANIHMVGCEKEVLDAVRAHARGCRAVVLHSFSSESYVRPFAEAGCLFSLNPRILARSDARLVRLVSAIPEDRLLLETDAPYVPRDFSGMADFAVRLAERTGDTGEGLITRTLDNARRIADV